MRLYECKGESPFSGGREMSLCVDRKGRMYWSRRFWGLGKAVNTENECVRLKEIAAVRVFSLG